MKVYRNLEEIQLSPSACALGMFDGVHTGHQVILEHAVRQARILGLERVVFSFANHPQSVLSTTPTQLLSSLKERLRYFEQLGFEHALIPDFNEALKNLPAKAFIDTVLSKSLQVKSVTVGYDHRFGKDRAGDGVLLEEAGKTLGFETHIISPIRMNDQIVSSTVIRKLLTYGDVEQANTLLGRAYTLSGAVIPGKQRGRLLGFPTANLELSSERLVPACGTYGGIAVLGNVHYRAVCNIGTNPTFGDVEQKRMEVYLLNYQGEAFYGESVTFSFYKKLRDEMKFSSPDALVKQIQQDCRVVSEDQDLALV